MPDVFTRWQAERRDRPLPEQDSEDLLAQLNESRSSGHRLLLARELARREEYSTLAGEWAAQVRGRIRYRDGWEQRVSEDAAWRPLAEPVLLHLLARRMKARRRYGRLVTMKERDLRGMLLFAQGLLLELDGEDPFAD